MATETLTIDFNASFLTLGPDSVAPFESFSAAFGEEADSEIFHTAAKRVVNDDDDEFDDDEDEDEKEEDDDDLEDDEVEEEEDEDDDEYEDDEDEDEDEDDEEEEEDDDVDELRVSSRR
jgi:hypothetical protein